MKAKILILGLTLIGIAACKKDIFTTSPRLTFSGINGNVFPNNSILSMQIQVTDKEGDIQDTVWVQEVSLSGCNPDASFTQPYQMPSFTPSKDLKATINVNYSYGSTSGAYPLLPGCNMKNDSCYFRFWLKDVAGHVSDTVSSPTIVLQN